MSRGDRLAPWSGVAFVVLVLGGAAAEWTKPASHASGADVVRFYVAHRSSERLAAVLLTLAFVALLAFAAVVRAQLLAAGSKSLAATTLAGAVLVSAGETLTTSATWALSDQPARLSPDAAQVLNLVVNDFVLVSAAGWLTFAVSAGLAIVRSRVLPAWLGWVSVVIGVLFITPLEVVGFFLFLAWTLVASLQLRGIRPAALVPTPAS